MQWLVFIYCLKSIKYWRTMRQKIVNTINKKFKPLIKLLKRTMLAQSILVTLVFLCRFSLNHAEIADYFTLARSSPVVFIILLSFGIATLSIFLMFLGLMMMGLVSVILKPAIIFDWLKNKLRKFLRWIRELEKQE